MAQVESCSDLQWSHSHPALQAKRTVLLLQSRISANVVICLISLVSQILMNMCTYFADVKKEEMSRYTSSEENAWYSSFPSLISMQGIYSAASPDISEGCVTTSSKCC